MNRKGYPKSYKMTLGDILFYLYDDWIMRIDIYYLYIIYFINKII